MREIELFNGRGVALVDDADCAAIAGLRWRLGAGRYAVATVSGQPVYMHRLLMRPGAGEEVDHANGRTLDNRRANLRVVAPRLNSANKRKSDPQSTSQFKGVSRAEGTRWRADGSRDGRTINLGRFSSERDAAEAYDAFARAEFGECACLNYPREGERGARRAA
jgi:hypothetical protein